eukprot:g3187.t1
MSNRCEWTGSTCPWGIQLVKDRGLRKRRNTTNDHNKNGRVERAPNHKRLKILLLRSSMSSTRIYISAVIQSVKKLATQVRKSKCRRGRSKRTRQSLREFGLVGARLRRSISQ